MSHDPYGRMGAYGCYTTNTTSTNTAGPAALKDRVGEAPFRCERCGLSLFAHQVMALGPGGQSPLWGLPVLAQPYRYHLPTYGVVCGPVYIRTHTSD